MTFTNSAHQFKPGRHVWVRPAKWNGKQGGTLVALHRFTQDEPFEVLRQVNIKGWPHYDLLAPDGATWQVAQLEVSSVPLGMSRDQVVLGTPRRAAA